MRDQPGAVDTAKIDGQPRAEQLAALVGVGGNLLHDPLPCSRAAVYLDRLTGEVMQVQRKVFRRWQVAADKRRHRVAPPMLAEGLRGTCANAFPHRIHGEQLGQLANVGRRPGHVAQVHVARHQAPYLALPFKGFNTLQQVHGSHPGRFGNGQRAADPRFNLGVAPQAVFTHRRGTEQVAGVDHRLVATVHGEVVDGPTIKRSSSIAPSTLMPGMAPRSPIIWLKPFHTLRPSPVGRSKKFWVMPMQKTTRSGS
eukprot:gene5047-5865_t